MKHVKLSEKDLQDFSFLTKNLAQNENVLRMKNYIQHGKITTYDHVFMVALFAFYINRKFNIKADELTLINACILHDFYLYDWHKRSIKVPLFKMHGFTHPYDASKNAKEIMNVDDEVAKAIESHMWPLNITNIPKGKIAWLLCIADKHCASKESVFNR